MGSFRKYWPSLTGRYWYQQERNTGNGCFIKWDGPGRCVWRLCSSDNPFKYMYSNKGSDPRRRSRSFSHRQAALKALKDHPPTAGWSDIMYGRAPTCGTSVIVSELFYRLCDL